MELLPEEVRASLPKLYAQDGTTNPIVHVKYFTPDSNWTWYATEGEAEEDETTDDAASDEEETPTDDESGDSEEDEEDEEDEEG